MRYIFLLLIKLKSWRIVGELPPIKKFIIIGFPHTSYWDGFLTVSAGFIYRIKIHWFLKTRLYHTPVAWLFRLLGAILLDNQSNRKTVEMIADEFNRRENFVVTISPEGTRKQVKTIKSGFYYIALAANIPIVLVVSNTQKKECCILGTFYPTGDYEKDLASIFQYYLRYDKTIALSLPFNNSRA